MRYSVIVSFILFILLLVFSSRLSNQIDSVLLEHGLFSYAIILRIILLLLSVLALIWESAIVVLLLLLIIVNIFSVRVDNVNILLFIVILALLNVWKIIRYNPPHSVKRGSYRGLLATFVASAGLIALLSIPAGIIIMKLPDMIMEWSGRNLEGDLAQFIKYSSSTLLFTIIVALLSFYLLYKMYDILSSVILLVGPGRTILSRYEISREYRSWKNNLVLFKGKSRDMLKEAIIVLFSLLVSPVIFPASRAIFSTLAGGMSKAIVAVYMLTGYLLAWLLTRVIILTITVSPNIKTLMTPQRVSKYLLAGLVLGIVIVFIHVLLGGNVYSLIYETVSGRPAPTPDPLYNVIGLGTLNYRVESLMKTLSEGLSTLVRILWGG